MLSLKIRQIPPRHRGPDHQLARQYPGGSGGRLHSRQNGAERRVCRCGGRVLAVPWRPRQSSAQRQTRRRHMAEHRHWPSEPRRKQGLLRRLPPAPYFLGRPGSPAGNLRKMPFGAGSSAERNLRGVESRARQPRLPTSRRLSTKFWRGPSTSGGSWKRPIQRRTSITKLAST